MIKLFIYDTTTGLFKYSDTGQVDYVLIDMPINCDFTLIEPPDTLKNWYWSEKEWQSEPKPTP